ncbi:MAG: hypothetical protein Ta2A_25480 [Treponemataceae bacterium]|nr:MAG: hypothetical protein Ta2A_25480 [Treponemataceae bacterium]
MDTDTVLAHIAAGDAAIRSAVKAERASNKHWTLVYLMAHPDTVFDAVVVDIKNYQATALIPSLALQQVITLSKTAALNDIIPVKCTKVDLPLLQAVFLEA